jgi:ATP synthase protein I
MAPLNEMEADEPEFKPMTAEEARQWSEKNPSVSPGAVVGVQALVGLVVALVAWGLTGRENVGWSAGYGALAVVIPAALFARGLARKWFGFFMWEMVKIALTVAMLFAAPRLVANLSWPAMLVGLVVTMKVYWVALVLRPKRRT